jgi:flagellar protein FlaG
MSNDIAMLRGLGLVGRSSSPAKADPALGGQRGATVEAGKVRKAEEGSSVEEVAHEVAKGLNGLVHELHRELHFSVDEDSGDTVIKVIDQETDEVLRQIPSEEMVVLRKRLEEAAGVIFQDSA